jgi:hypothetical protein
MNQGKSDFGKIRGYSRIATGWYMGLDEGNCIPMK